MLEVRCMQCGVPMASLHELCNDCWEDYTTTCCCCDIEDFAYELHTAEGAIGSPDCEYLWCYGCWTLLQKEW